MTRKEWNERRQGGAAIADEPAVLRRRAKDLAAEGYRDEYVAVFLRAADELEVRRRCAVGLLETEQEAVNLMADNRRLRNTLVAVFTQVRARKPAGWPDQVLETVKGALAAVREVGKGRRILAIDVPPDIARAELEGKIAEQLDAHFGGEAKDDAAATDATESA